jgi:hypothetical protein
MLFKEIIPVFAENHTKPITQNATLLIPNAYYTFNVNKNHRHTTITVKKTTLLLYHTTSFDRLNGHHQVYIHKIETYKTKMVKTMSNISFIQNM